MKEDNIEKEKRIIVVVLEADTDVSLNEIREDLDRVINCASYYYEMLRIAEICKTCSKKLCPVNSKNGRKLSKICEIKTCPWRTEEYVIKDVMETQSDYTVSKDTAREIVGNYEKKRRESNEV